MKTLMLLLFFCHVSSGVKHSVKAYIMGYSGVQNIPDYMGLLYLDEMMMTYYDSDMKAPEPRQNWVRRSMEDDRHYWEGVALDCKLYQQMFKAEVDGFNQTGGVHINQQMFGCAWDDETGKVDGYKQYGYNGEDFITFDLETETWITAHPLARITKQAWDRNKVNNVRWKNFLTNTCLAWLRKYLNNGQSHLQKTELPSVSLLQKTPSSPVTCHATGFYPDRAMMFWRKDGEEFHEDVDHGEILPNHDGSFQTSVDLNLSSVTPEDWRRYDCVFQLSGVEDDIVTRLDKKAILTNEGKTVEENLMNMTVIIIVAVAVLALALAIAGIGFFVYKQKKAKRPPSPEDKPDPEAKCPLQSNANTPS